MGKKNSGDGGNFVVSLATTAAVMGSRKVLAAGWSKASGRTAPTDPADREISVVESLIFAAVAGVIAEVIKLLIARSTTSASPAAEGDAAEAS